MNDDTTDASSQRLDQWMWHARLFKTRSLATKFIADGHVRVTRAGETSRVEKPSFPATPGDTLSYSRAERLRIIVIEALAKRRGPAAEAQTLYTDQSPAPAPKRKESVIPFQRAKGLGRPTKKERRALNALKT